MENTLIKNCYVIVCGPAVGKTYLANIDKRFFDLDGEKAKYKYGLYNATEEELESGKLNRGEVVNRDSNEWAIKKMHEEINKKHCVLISYHGKLLEYIVNNNIDYCLVFAGKELPKEYAQRMKNRKNTDKFINGMTNDDIWEKFYFDNINDTRATYKIELEKGMYLSDIKDRFVL